MDSGMKTILQTRLARGKKSLSLSMRLPTRPGKGWASSRAPLLPDTMDSHTCFNKLSTYSIT